MYGIHEFAPFDIKKSLKFDLITKTYGASLPYIEEVDL